MDIPIGAIFAAANALARRHPIAGVDADDWAGELYLAVASRIGEYSRSRGSLPSWIARCVAPRITRKVLRDNGIYRGKRDGADEWKRPVAAATELDTRGFEGLESIGRLRAFVSMSEPERKAWSARLHPRRRTNGKPGPHR